MKKNVKKVKEEKMYQKFVENAGVYKGSFTADQDLINDVGYGRIGYIKTKFNNPSPYETDEQSDIYPYTTLYSFIDKVPFKENFTFLPKNIDEFNIHGLNPIVIRQWRGKWQDNMGISLYRRIAQYYIRFAGIWEELCSKQPGYCFK